MLPQFHKADIKGEQHHYHSSYTEDEKQVVEALFSPGHEK
jgi:hypothetical protein